MKITNIRRSPRQCGKFAESEYSGGFFRCYCLYALCTDCIIDGSIPKLYIDTEIWRT